MVKPSRTTRETNGLIQTLFDSDVGREVLEYLHDTYFMKASTMASNALQLAFNEGQRSVVLDLQNRLDNTAAPFVVSEFRNL